MSRRFCGSSAFRKGLWFVHGAMRHPVKVSEAHLIISTEGSNINSLKIILRPFVRGLAAPSQAALG